MTVQGWLKSSQARLEAANVGSVRLDTELLVAHVLNKPREWVLAHGDEPLAKTNLNKLSTLLDRRVARHPLVHLTGHREFFGLEFEITPDVLTPRPESESMIEWAVKYTPQDGRLIDIGTGSGALAIAVAARRPDLEITGTDVTAESLAVAQRNVARHGASIKLLKSDLWEKIDGRFSTVITNLPYLRDDEQITEEVQKEPAIALFGGTDGLDLYRRFLTGLPQHLGPGGFLFTECDPWQHEVLQAEAAKHGLETIEEDYFILGFKNSA